MLEPLRNSSSYYLLSAYKLEGKDSQRKKIERKVQKAVGETTITQKTHNIVAIRFPISFFRLLLGALKDELICNDTENIPAGQI